MVMFLIVVYCVFMAGILGLQFFWALKNKGFLITLGCFVLFFGAIILYRLNQERRKGMKKDQAVYILRCLDCLVDEMILSPRIVDAKCLHCGDYFCGGHIADHLKEKHRVATTNDHTKRKI